MTTSDLYIIAAGKGSRMGGSVPKALVPIADGEPSLTTLLKQVVSKFDSVFVITNAVIQDQWDAYFDQLDPTLIENVVHNVPISSGLGDGHAVMQGLGAVENAFRHRGLHDDIVICWGDVFIPDNRIVDELLAKPLGESGVIPVVREDNPYVTLLTDERMWISSVDFSKYGEKHPTGFHDQSIFRFKRSVLWNALRTLHDAYWKGGRYITQGGELSTLYAFHYLSNICRPAMAYETDFPTLSFNTPEEVAAIQREINKSWKSQFSSR